MPGRRFKVVVTDADYPDHEPEKRVLGELAEVVKQPYRTEEELIGLTRDADALLVQYAKITRRVISGLKRARVIVRYGVGYDNVDVAAATERGIYVAHVTGYCDTEVADHTMALTLCLARKVALADASVRSGRWDWRALREVHRLRGTAAGVIGLGSIGREVARRLAAFGLRVTGYDPYVSGGSLEGLGVEPVDLPALLRHSDIVTIHVPLTEETRHLIGEEELRSMKPSALLINTSRGPVVDEEALGRALKSGRIGAAALDVFEEEPLPPESPLRGLGNVILTPHMAWYSEESLRELQERAAQEVREVLEFGRPPRNVVPEQRGMTFRPDRGSARP